MGKGNRADDAYERHARWRQELWNRVNILCVFFFSIMMMMMMMMMEEGNNGDKGWRFGSRMETSTSTLYSSSKNAFIGCGVCAVCFAFVAPKNRCEET
jgi:hypothetical protein